MVEPDEAKQASHAILRQLSVRINETLPVIEDGSELTPRSSEEVAERAFVLGAVIRAGFGHDRQSLLECLDKSGRREQLTTQEEDFMTTAEPTKQQMVNATWLIEGVQSLAWCLGLADLRITHPCDENLSSHFPEPHQPADNFIASAKLRPFDELYQQADLHYRLHWAARDARLNGYDCPVQEGLVGERRRAIDWTIGVGPDWDEIPMDT